MDYKKVAIFVLLVLAVLLLALPAAAWFGGLGFGGWGFRGLGFGGWGFRGMGFPFWGGMGFPVLGRLWRLRLAVRRLWPRGMRLVSSCEKGLHENDSMIASRRGQRLLHFY